LTHLTAIATTFYWSISTIRSSILNEYANITLEPSHKNYITNTVKEMYTPLSLLNECSKGYHLSRGSRRGLHFDVCGFLSPRLFYINRYTWFSNATYIQSRTI